MPSPRSRSPSKWAAASSATTSARLLKDGTRAADYVGVEVKRERVELLTQHHRIFGVVTLARDGYRSRVTDLLNASDKDFVALAEVKVEPLDPNQSEEMHPFLAVHRRHIVYAVSHGEVPEGQKR